MRALLITAVALAFAGPAMAQPVTPAEMVGTYQLTVAPEPGSVCPAGNANFQVLAVNGETADVVLDRTPVSARYYPQTQTFSAQIPFPDAAHVVQLDGGFSRGGGQITLTATVEFPPERPCKALLSGSIPDPGASGAASPAASTPAAPALGSAPTASTPPVFGVSANGQPVDMTPYQPRQRGLKDARLLSWTSVLTFIAGIVIRLALRRRKDAAPPAATPAAAAPPTPTPAPSPPPAPEPVAPPPPSAKKRAPRKKPTPQEELNEGEDELGDG